MTDEEFGSICFGAFLGVAAASLFWGLMIVGVFNPNWQRQAYVHGAAEYNQKTGEWQWKPLAKETADE